MFSSRTELAYITVLVRRCFEKTLSAVPSGLNLSYDNDNGNGSGNGNGNAK